MKLTHSTISQAELCELEGVSHTHAGKLGTLLFAIRQQAMLQNEVAKLVEGLSPQEMDQLELETRGRPLLRAAFVKMGMSRIPLTGSRFSYAGPTQRISISRSWAKESQSSYQTQSPAAFEYHLQASAQTLEYPDYLSTKTVAEILQITPQMVRRYCQDGQLVATRTMGLVGEWRIDTQAFVDQEPSRLVKLQGIMGDRAERNTQLAEKVRQSADRPEMQQLLDGIDDRRVESEQKRGTD